MSTVDRRWNAFARDLQRALARLAPEWSDVASHDPGITVLEALDYALADLQYRRGALDERGRALATSIAERARVLASTGDPAPADTHKDCDGLTRVNYLHGMLLGADEFRTEQRYVLERLDRRNRLLHGAGVVTGLAVTAEGDGAGTRVVVAPGLAFDRAGREICVPAEVRVPLPESAAGREPLFVVVRYVERPCGTVPSLVEGPDGDVGAAPATAPHRIVESFDIALSAVPAVDAIALARVRPLRGAWHIDRRFRPVRAAR